VIRKTKKTPSNC